jgi:hypothetical protein
MRTIRLALLLAALPLLAGCALLPLLPGFPHPSAAGDLKPGVCLEGMVGNDSDRDSIVPCDASHRFEVAAIIEWPGMNAFIDDNGEFSYSRLHPASPSSDDGVNEYLDWAFAACQESVMEVAAIADVEVDGHTAADLWLRLGGGYGVDVSLASRTAFQAGDHRTVCSAAWYNDYGAPTTVEFPPGVRFADVNTTSLPIEQRECWDDDYELIGCDQEHVAQVVVDFDGLEAFGPELITRVAEGNSTESDWDLAAQLCDELTDESMARPEFMYGLSYYADSQSDYGWGSWDGEVDPELTYRFACLIAAPEIGDKLIGDVFAGTAEIVPAGTGRA